MSQKELDCLASVFVAEKARAHSIPTVEAGRLRLHLITALEGGAVQRRSTTLAGMAGTAAKLGPRRIVLPIKSIVTVGFDECDWSETPETGSGS